MNGWLLQVALGSTGLALTALATAAVLHGWRHRPVASYRLASAVLAMVGAINIPIIHFSVEWWSSLHQGATLVREGGPAMPPEMLYPLLANILGFTLLFGALLLSRVRTEVLFRERRKRWVRNELLDSGGQG